MRQCGSAAEGDAVRCEACGGATWRVPDLYYVRAVTIAVGLVALLAVVLVGVVAAMVVTRRFGITHSWCYLSDISQRTPPR